MLQHSSVTERAYSIDPHLGFPLDIGTKRCQVSHFHFSHHFPGLGVAGALSAGVKPSSVIALVYEVVYAVAKVLAVVPIPRWESPVQVECFLNAAYNEQTIVNHLHWSSLPKPLASSIR